MRQWNNLVYRNSWRWTCKCPKHVEAIYENKIIVKLFASSWYISLLIYMMHGHTYIKFSFSVIYFSSLACGSNLCVPVYLVLMKLEFLTTTMLLLLLLLFLLSSLSSSSSLLLSSSSLSSSFVVVLTISWIPYYYCYYYYPCYHLYAGYLQLYTWNEPCS